MPATPPPSPRAQIPLIFLSLLIGLLTGLVIVGFRLGIQALGAWSLAGMQALRTAEPGQIALGELGLMAVGLLLGTLVAWRPQIKGSGIPQVEAALAHRLPLSWWPELPAKLLGGMLGIGCGLSLGREGPSVQIGAYLGEATRVAARRRTAERQWLVTAGAAAGLSAAFDAPLAGVLFALEELRRHISPLLLACAMGASLAADAVAGHFFGLGPIFQFHAVQVLPVTDLPWVLLLGALSALGGDLFKRTLYAAQDLYPRLGLPPIARPALPLLLTLPLAWWLAPVLGGGHLLIESLAGAQVALAAIPLLFAVKLLFTALCYGSGVPGGIFLPLLVCGALLGDGLGQGLAATGWVAPHQAMNFMIIGMAAFFAAVVRAPITGAVLILEMSGNFNHLLSLVAACLTAHVVAELLRSRPVYEVLLERLQAGRPHPPAG